VAFILIDLVAVLVAGCVVILRARTQTRMEIAASMHLAEMLVGDTANFAQERLAQQFLDALPGQLRSLRHVRIVVKDGSGTAVPLRPPYKAADHITAPRWFTALVAPHVKLQTVSVTAKGRAVGRVDIVGEPGDEISEVWDNLVAMGIVALFVNLGMLGALYVLFGQVLGPLTALATGLSDLERQSYNARLSRPHARELAAIADRFNALAHALAGARLENRKLSQRLISAQDQERRRTALDLHDEVGPCLFGLKAYASSIAGAANELSDKTRESMVKKSREMLGIVEHLQSINRSMLDRLRPMALGHVPLGELLVQLVRERERQHAATSFEIAVGAISHSYGDAIDLTIYRSTQESLTNVMRHAQAKRVVVTLRYATETSQLELTIRDDGRGIPPDAHEGVGMSGIRERVEGLGGRYAISNEGGHGTCVHISIPTVEQQTAAIV
jgi:two-component system, NarL family, sensor histidine kinase UhpB